MRTTISLIVTALVIAGGALQAQTPAPVVVQSAVAPAAAPAAAQVAPGAAASALPAALQMLQAMKAANDETLKKQEAALVQLEELQKAADQLKVYSKRG